MKRLSGIFSFGSSSKTSKDAPKGGELSAISEKTLVGLQRIVFFLEQTYPTRLFDFAGPSIDRARESQVTDLASLILTGTLSDGFLQSQDNFDNIHLAVRSVLTAHRPLIPPDSIRLFISTPLNKIDDFLEKHCSQVSKEAFVLLMTYFANFPTPKPSSPSVYSFLGVHMVKPVENTYDDEEDYQEDLRLCGSHFNRLLGEKYRKKQKQTVAPGAGASETAEASRNFIPIQERSVKCTFKGQGKPNERSLQQYMELHGTVINVRKIRIHDFDTIVKYVALSLLLSYYTPICRLV